MNPITALLAALGVLTAIFVGGWARVIMAVRSGGAATASPATDARFPTPLALGTGAVTNFFDTLGIGLYAPCMILVSLLGMSETTAFPIMMGSCAFLMPVGSLKFIKERAYSLRVALGLALGGIPGVIIAAKIVKSLDLVTVRWLVIVVVLYTAITMLYSAFSEPATAKDDVPARLS